MKPRNQNGYRFTELTQCSRSLSGLNQQQFLRERRLLSGAAGSHAGDCSDGAVVSGHAHRAGLLSDYLPTHTGYHE